MEKKEVAFAGTFGKNPPDWEVVLRIIDPAAYLCGSERLPRPRRLTAQGIAACCGRDVHVVLTEMEKSGRVSGYYCPDPMAPIFYLNDLRGRMIATGSRMNDWGYFHTFADQHPKAKGFSRRIRAGESNEMPTPFDPQDKGDQVYEALVKEGMKVMGFTLYGERR